MICVRLILAAVIVLAPLTARADSMLSNLRMTLYHELGHAVFDQLGLPVYGVEETAADVFALALAERLHPEEELTAILADMVAGMRAEAETELFDHWAQYMPAGQRLARAICLWYGAAPDGRGMRARAWGMPLESAARCRSDGRDMRAAWDPVLNRLRPEAGRTGDTLRLAAGEKRLGRLSRDIKRVNRAVALPRPVPVRVESCGEANAFYFGDTGRIVICTEYLAELAGHPPH